MKTKKMFMLGIMFAGLLVSLASADHFGGVSGFSSGRYQNVIAYTEITETAPIKRISVIVLKEGQGTGSGAILTVRDARQPEEFTAHEVRQSVSCSVALPCGAPAGTKLSCVPQQLIFPAGRPIQLETLRYSTCDSDPVLNVQVAY